MGPYDATEVTFDNSTSGLPGAPAETQAAIDALDALTDAHITNISNPHSVSAAQAGADPVGTAAAAVAAHEAASPAHDAVDVGFNNAVSGLAATDVQAAIDALDALTDAHVANTSNPHGVTAVQVGADTVGTAAAAVAAHEAASPAHDAVDILFDDTAAALGETDVQGAIDEVSLRLPRPLQVIAVGQIGGNTKVFASSEAFGSWEDITSIVPLPSSGLSVSLVDPDRGIYVLAGEGGAILHSNNGRKFSQRTPPGAYSGDYNNGWFSRRHRRFFLSGPNVLHASYDGLTWVVVNQSGSNTTATFNGMSEDDSGRIVGATVTDQLLYSDDVGESFVTPSTPPTVSNPSFLDVVWTGTQFVAVVDNSADGCATSPDGDVWTDRSVAAGTDALVWVTHVPELDRLVSGGIAGVYTSDDGGSTWTLRSFDGTFTSGGIDGSGFSPYFNAVIAVGDTEVQYSDDGVTWTSIELGGGGVFQGVNAEWLTNPDSGASAISSLPVGGDLSGTTSAATVVSVGGQSAATIGNHVSGVTSPAHVASAISYSNVTSGLAATNAQAAIDEVEGRVDALEITPVLGGAGGLGDTANLTARGVQHLVAYVELDGSSVTWSAIGTLFDVNAGGSVVAEVYLYDVGSDGSPIAPVLRSTLTFPNANQGNFDVVSQALTPSATPGTDTDEILNSSRVYEIRAVLDPADVGADGDVFAFGKVRFV